MNRTLHILAGLAFVVASFAAASSAHAACRPPSYCDPQGACWTLQQVADKAQRRFGGEGFSRPLVRLRPHAPTNTCLWFEVKMSRRDGCVLTAYWGVRSGLIRSEARCER